MRSGQDLGTTATVATALHRTTCRPASRWGVTLAILVLGSMSVLGASSGSAFAEAPGHGRSCKHPTNITAEYCAGDFTTCPQNLGNCNSQYYTGEYIAQPVSSPACNPYNNQNDYTSQTTGETYYGYANDEDKTSAGSAWACQSNTGEEKLETGFWGYSFTAWKSSGSTYSFGAYMSGAFYWVVSAYVSAHGNCDAQATVTVSFGMAAYDNTKAAGAGYSTGSGVFSEDLNVGPGCGGGTYSGTQSDSNDYTSFTSSGSAISSGDSITVRANAFFDVWVNAGPSLSGSDHASAELDATGDMSNPTNYMTITSMNAN